MDKEKALGALKIFTEKIIDISEERITSGQQLTDTISDMEKFADEFEPEWETANRETIDDIDSASDEEFFELCKDSVKYFYGAVPKVMVSNLRKREKAADFMVKWLDSPILTKDINSSALTHEELDETDSVSYAIFLAGKMENEILYPVLSGIFQSCLTTNEKFLEDIITSMSSPKAIPEIIKLLQDEDLHLAKRADVMQMVCNTGVKSDELFKLMKKSFKLLCKDPSKEVVGAMLMYDYGDPRIVTALRKMAADKIEASAAHPGGDNTNIYVLLSMINKLGGNTADMTGGKNLFET